MKDDQLYLVDIADRIARIEAYTQQGRDAFMQSPLIQDAVIGNLEIIGEVANRISAQRKSERVSVPWRQMVGLRNLLIHDYGRVNLNIIWQIVESEIPAFKRSVEDMLGEWQ